MAIVETEIVEPVVEEKTIDDRYDYIGKSIRRVDADAKVRGRTQYTSDFTLPNMLHGKLLLSDQVYARIVSIDTSKAEALEGVRAVITAADAPSVRYGIYIQDREIFARDVVRYRGEVVAAVAATDEATAAQAVKMIEIEYEELPPVLSAEAGLADDAPILHPLVKEYGAIFPYIRHGNVCFESTVGIGDPESAMASADVVVEHTYTTPAHNQAPIETHAAIASYDHNGKLTVWTGTQQLSVCHGELARALGLPMSQVRVVPLWVGGGFGGKLKTTIEPMVALLAKAANRPVQLVLTREEEFLTTRGRAPFSIHIKTGAMRDGTLVARETEITVDAGGYCDHSLGAAGHAMTSSQGSYNIPNSRAHARLVYTNNPDYGCMRGYGNSQMMFAAEAHMDEIAAALEMDPAELRYKNIWKDGDRLIQTQVISTPMIKDCMDQALDLFDYDEKIKNLPPNRGIGIANITKTAGLLASSASMKVNEDASVSLITAAVDIGTGTHTILIQIAAETLGIPIAQIHVASLDSDSAPFDLGSIASRTVTNTGNAVRLAAEDLRAKLMEVAAKTLQTSVEQLTYDHGRAYLTENPEVALEFAAMVAIAIYTATGPVAGYGSYNGDVAFSETVGEGFPESILPALGFATHVVEVEVDPETGRVDLLNYVAVHDVGQVINQQTLEGQIEGGVGQGIGFGLYEEMVLDHGKILNPSLSEYLLPSVLEMPDIQTAALGSGDDAGPFGSKGVGEHIIGAPAPAIANAVFAATGRMIRELPITSEKLFFALSK
jgi:CO/xanthine dehydrogenase Mo-binding subunit